MLISNLKKRKIFFGLISCVIGYFLGGLLIEPCQSTMFTRSEPDPEFTATEGIVNQSMIRYYQPGTATNIYVGMMSAQKYLVLRVQEALNDWLSKGDWKVEVFADPGNVKVYTPPGFDFNIVNIHKVDDTAYPPQQKSFSLLRHMYDHHIDSYDWFMRIDDDLYLHSHRLHTLLSRMNSSAPIYFGSPGFGIDADDGIEEGMYFLMGGPGIILSRGLLLELRKYMGYCVKHLFSPHEDVEVGRCVWKYVKNAVIPVAWEVVELFVQQYDKTTGDTINIIVDSLTELQKNKPVTYHSLKDARLMHDLHNRILQNKMHQLLERTASLREEVDSMKTLLSLDMVLSLKPKLRQSTHRLVTSYKGKKEDESNYLGGDESIRRRHAGGDTREMRSWPDNSVWQPLSAHPNQIESFLPWVYWDKYYRYQPSKDVPARGHSAHERTEYNKLLELIDGTLIKEICPQFPTDRRFERSYFQVNPTRGVHFMTVHKAFDQDIKSKRKIRRNKEKGKERYCLMKLTRGFGVEIFREHTIGFTITDELMYNEGMSLGGYLQSIGKLTSSSSSSRYRGRGQLYNLQPPPPPPTVDRLVYVVPLSGRYQALEKFMEGYKQNFLLPIKRKQTNQLESNVLLVVVLFGQPPATKGSDDAMSIQRANAQLLKSYQQEFGDNLVQYYHVNYGVNKFSRGAGLQFGALIAAENDIIFFIDVDMLVTSSLASQCRRNVLRGVRSWFPVPYSQYDPERRCEKVKMSPHDVVVTAGDDFAVGEEIGFWRNFGLGITCMYKSDFALAGGFDLSIEGWGEEDVRLFISILQSGVDTFRANERDLIHIYHQKYCSPSLDGEQARACRDGSDIGGEIADRMRRLIVLCQLQGSIHKRG